MIWKENLNIFFIFATKQNIHDYEPEDKENLKHLISY